MKKEDVTEKEEESNGKETPSSVRQRQDTARHTKMEKRGGVAPKIIFSVLGTKNKRPDINRWKHNKNRTEKKGSNGASVTRNDIGLRGTHLHECNRVERGRSQEKESHGNEPSKTI